MVDTTLHTSLTTFLQNKLPVYLDWLQLLVATNSFTANPRGVDAVGNLMTDMLAPLNFRAERVAADNALYGNHLVLHRPAAVPDAPTIALITHLDTVYQAIEERQNDFHWREEGDRLYGPGTYDIKGGTVLMFMVLDALAALAPDLFSQVNWLLLANAAEEALVKDFGDLCRERIPADALACLVFEGGHRRGDHYDLVVARKGMARYRVEVEGKAAHAGTSHPLGANAIVQLAEVIQRVAGFTDHAQQITFNPGTVGGGTVINRVPHLAVMSVEMRAFDPAVFQEGHSKMLALDGLSTVRSVADDYPCRVHVRVQGEWEPWSPNPATDNLLALWQETAVDLGWRVGAEERGGLSDGNQTWRFVPTIDGLGPDGGNAHCSERSADGSKDQEYALKSSFVPKAVLNTLAIMRLLKTKRPQQTEIDFISQ